jgi:hypothetical protein
MNSLEDVTILWVDDYYDIPLAGMCMVNNEWHYFDQIGSQQGQDGSEEFVYHIYKLSDKERRYEQTKHAWFCRYVGTHFDYRVDPAFRKVKPSNEHHLFYDKFEDDKRDYSKNEILGEFIL